MKGKAQNKLQNNYKCIEYCVRPFFMTTRVCYTAEDLAICGLMNCIRCLQSEGVQVFMRCFCTVLKNIGITKCKIKKSDRIFKGLIFPKTRHWKFSDTCLMLLLLRRIPQPYGWVLVQQVFSLLYLCQTQLHEIFSHLWNLKNQQNTSLLG